MTNTIAHDIHSTRNIGIVCLLSLFLGTLYVFLVPAGLPYDEPSHWDIVQHYARGMILPVLGTPGVTYEAYQPPLYYAFSGLLSYLTGLAGEKFAFYAVRWFSLLSMLPIIYCTYLLASRVFGKNRYGALLATIFVGGNPVLLAIAASVQNDALSIALSLLIIALAARYIGDRPADEPIDTRVIFLLGALCSAAILCKLTNAYLLFALPLYLLLVRRNWRETLRFSALYFLPVILFASWWFARNHMLYGDWTSASAMKTFFPEGVNAPVALLDWRQWLRVLQNGLIYHWIPSEYFRNEVEVSAPAKVLVILATLSSLAGWVVFGIRKAAAGKSGNTSVTSSSSSRRAILLLGVCYGVCMAVYLRNLITEWFLPARILLVATVSPVVFFIGGWEHYSASPKFGKYIRYALMALLLLAYGLIHFSILRQASLLPVQGYTIPLA